MGGCDMISHLIFSYALAFVPAARMVAGVPVLVGMAVQDLTNVINTVAAGLVVIGAGWQAAKRRIKKIGDDSQQVEKCRKTLAACKKSRLRWKRLALKFRAKVGRAERDAEHRIEEAERKARHAERNLQEVTNLYEIQEKRFEQKRLRNAELEARVNDLEAQLRSRQAKPDPD